MNKFDPHEKLNKEQDAALEFYMKRCLDLESQMEILKQRVQQLEWSLKEQD